MCGNIALNFAYTLTRSIWDKCVWLVGHGHGHLRKFVKVEKVEFERCDENKKG